LRWDPAALPRQAGKTFVVTGGNAGLGYFISEQLVGAGAHVVIASRSAERGAAALRALRGRVRGASAELVVIDVADLESVRAGAAELASRESLDGLIANAGMVSPPKVRTTTAASNELVLATNVIGHFVLTDLLLPVLRRTPGSRVVTMGSQATRLINFRVDDLQLERGYSSWRAYAQSKIVLESFGFELDRRLRATGADVSSLVAHPGYSVGGLAPRISGVNEPSRGQRFGDALQNLFGAQGKDRGAWSAVRAVTDPDAVGGQYWGPRWRMRGAPTLQKPAAVCVDPQIGARIWSYLEEFAAQPFVVA
jgi:NAD(P)-dependent dehydrogenase (short-subunit alcohol dehydrogenase family)